MPSYPIALAFRKGAVFTEKMAASLSREAADGHLELACVSAETPEDVPPLPWTLPFVPMDELSSPEVRWIFLMGDSKENAGIIDRRKDALKQLMPKAALRLGQRVGAAVLGGRNARPWKDFDGWGKPLLPGNGSESGYDPLGEYAVGPEKVIPGRVLEIPAFRMEEYMRLRERGITFISDNCWGGLMYNTLGLEMRSPFINMFIRWEFYSRLLSDLPAYMAQPLVPLRLRKSPQGGVVYPVAALGDVEIHLNHARTPTELEKYARQWYRRAARMDMDNLMVQTNFATREVWEERREFFESLPCGKIGFSPFPADSEDVVYLSCTGAFADSTAECSRACAKNSLPIPIPYDFLDTYLSGKLSAPRV